MAQGSVGFCTLLAAFFLAAPAGAPLAAPAIIIDSASGQVLYAEETERVWYPASLTKLMTAYLVFEAVRDGKLSWQSETIVSPHANAQPPVKVGVRSGQTIALGLVVQGMIVGSANDLAMVAAEAVAGDEAAFVERMNVTARRLGMLRTHFTNPSGLPDEQQVSTAYDLAVLAQAILRDFPDHAHMFAAHEVSIGSRTITTVNGLLVGFAGADGMKTGFTCAAGYNIVATATRNGRRLLAVVLGALSRDVRTQRISGLLDSAFRTGPVEERRDGFQHVSAGVDSELPLTPADLSKTVMSPVCGNRPMIPRRVISASAAKTDIVAAVNAKGKASGARTRLVAGKTDIVAAGNAKCKASGARTRLVAAKTHPETNAEVLSPFDRSQPYPR
jgi:D-alanyl-D-alanine carboxypeptidase